MSRIQLPPREVIRHHQNSIPIDVVALAHDLGINVYSASESKNLSGKIIRDSKLGGASGYAIFVNGDDSPTRQRFTIAHEIAHFVLHKDEIGDGIVEDTLYRSGLSNKKEVEANKFAADILMPWHLINLAMREPVSNIQELATRFHVSQSAMSIRLGIPS